MTTLIDHLLTSIKHIDDVDAEISLQPADIEVSSVEHFDDVRIGKDLV